MAAAGLRWWWWWYCQWAYIGSCMSFFFPPSLGCRRNSTHTVAMAQRQLGVPNEQRERTYRELEVDRWEYGGDRVGGGGGGVRANVLRTIHTKLTAAASFHPGRAAVPVYGVPCGLQSTQRTWLHSRRAVLATAPAALFLSLFVPPLVRVLFLSIRSSPSAFVAVLPFTRQPPSLLHSHYSSRLTYQLRRVSLAPAVDARYHYDLQ